MRIDVGAVTISYDWNDCPRHGRTPVVLSHSLATTSRMWDAQIEALTARHPVLTFDTRGHGESSVPPGPYSVQSLAEDVRALLDLLKLTQVHFVGLSLGGIIGQVLALRHPGRLLSLGLCDTSPRTPPEAHALWDERIALALAEGMGSLVEQTLARWFTAGFISRRPEVVDKVKTMITNTDPVGYAGCAAAVKGHDALERLGDIRVPTLILAGSDDPGMPRQTAEQMRDAIPGAELVVVGPAAHLSNMEQTERFNEALLRFIDRAEE